MLTHTRTHLIFFTNKFFTVMHFIFMHMYTHMCIYAYTWIMLSADLFSYSSTLYTLRQRKFPSRSRMGFCGNPTNFLVHVRAVSYT